MSVCLVADGSTDRPTDNAKKKGTAKKIEYAKKENFLMPFS